MILLLIIITSGIEGLRIALAIIVVILGAEVVCFLIRLISFSPVLLIAIAHIALIIIIGISFAFTIRSKVLTFIGEGTILRAAEMIVASLRMIISVILVVVILIVLVLI